MATKAKIAKPAARSKAAKVASATKKAVKTRRGSASVPAKKAKLRTTAAQTAPVSSARKHPATNKASSEEMPVSKSAAKAASPPQPEQTREPVISHFESEQESDTHIDISQVVTDLELARTPRSPNAQMIAAQARGSKAAEFIRTETARLAKTGQPVSAVFDINPYDLFLEAGWNKRNFNTPHRKQRVGTIGVSIANTPGVKETMICHLKGDKIYVHSGWTRLLSTYYAIEVLGAEIMAVPVRLGRSGENDGDRMFSQIVNNMGQPLNHLETGAVIKDLYMMQWPIDLIAARAGKKPQAIKQMLDTQEMPQRILSLIDDGTIKMTFALQEWRKSNQDPDVCWERLQASIKRAQQLGAPKVMPKHAPDAPPRKRRRSATEKPSSRARLSPEEALHGLRLIFERITVHEQDEVEGIMLLNIDKPDFEEAKRLLYADPGGESSDPAASQPEADQDGVTEQDEEVGSGEASDKEDEEVSIAEDDEVDPGQDDNGEGAEIANAAIEAEEAEIAGSGDQPVVDNDEELAGHPDNKEAKTA
jgi:hypothetical protein